METLIIVLIVAGLLVVGSAAFVITRRRGTDLEIDAVDAPSVGAPAATDVESETVEATDTVTDDDVHSGAAVIDEPLVKPSFFERLGKARTAFTGYLGGLVGMSKIGDDEWEELEDALIQADVGVAASMALIADVQAQAKETGAENGEEVLGLLKARMHQELAGKDRSLTIDDGQTNVWLFVGVNGVGKTTTIGMVGRRLVADGHQPLMAAGDTFRAAAAEQLTMWAERSGAEIVRGNEGGDPS
ncbi:MAG: signal recognition particle receptor subunit alpha, partial [Actinomycetota bacterium]